ncbi:hypothetical protein [Glycomyces sp. NPDC021274]|uniref:hypothetical protein n=1 Tax=Glycomyces sp. NPDC021274 TaxID=3155120 RepID=UPI0033D8DABE
MSKLEFTAALVGDLVWPLVVVAGLLLFRKTMQDAVSKLLGKGSGHLEGWGVVAKWDAITARAEAASEAEAESDETATPSDLGAALGAKEDSEPQPQADIDTANGQTDASKIEIKKEPPAESRRKKFESVLLNHHEMPSSDSQISRWILESLAEKNGEQLIQYGKNRLGRALWRFLERHEPAPTEFNALRLQRLMRKAIDSENLSQNSVDALRDVFKMLAAVNSGDVFLTRGRAVDLLLVTNQASVSIDRDTDLRIGSD